MNKKEEDSPETHQYCAAPNPAQWAIVYSDDGGDVFAASQRTAVRLQIELSHTTCLHVHVQEPYNRLVRTVTVHPVACPLLGVLFPCVDTLCDRGEADYAPLVDAIGVHAMHVQPCVKGTTSFQVDAFRFSDKRYTKIAELTVQPQTNTVNNVFTMYPSTKHTWPVWEKSEDGDKVVRTVKSNYKLTNENCTNAQTKRPLWDPYFVTVGGCAINALKNATPPLPMPESAPEPKTVRDALDAITNAASSIHRHRNTSLKEASGAPYRS
jgi:hypothetical protein